MREPIGVLHLVDCLNVGGTERQMFELVRGLDRRDPDKLRVVPNGIDVAAFDARARREPDPPLPALGAHEARMVMVASMHLPDKGHGDLLEAAALLKTRGRRPQLLIVSD